MVVNGAIGCTNLPRKAENQEEDSNDHSRPTTDTFFTKTCTLFTDYTVVPSVPHS